MSLSTSPVQRTSQLITHSTSHSSSNKSHGSTVQWVSDETDDRHVKINGLSPPSSPSRPITPFLQTTTTATSLLPVTHSHSLSSAPSSTIMHTSPSSTHDRNSLSKEDMKPDGKTNHSIINISSQPSSMKITTPLNIPQQPPSPSPSPSPPPDATLLSHPKFRTFTSTNGHTKTTTMTPSTDPQITTHKDASMSSLGLNDDSIPSLQLDTPQSPPITTQPHITPIEIETVQKPTWTLLFSDSALECTFQKYLFTFNNVSLLQLILSVITLIIVGIYRDIDRYSGNHDIFGKRLGYICTSAILMCIVVGMIYLRSLRKRVPSIWITVLFTLAGCLWAVGGVIGNDTARLPTQSMYLIYFLLIGHIVGHMFLFIHITISSCIICIVYVITAFIYASGDERITDPAINVTTLLLCTLLLCIHSYQYERNQRYTYQLNIQSLMDRQRLKKEATELREEVYALVLEKYDIADVESNIDLKSPLEKAMVLLQMMEREKTLSKENFTRVKQIIELLGTSSDIFKPKVEQVLRGERNALDDDTTKWLISLVEDEGHHNNTDSLSPERKLVAIDGSLQSHSTVSSGLRGIPGTTSSDIAVSLASEEELTFSKIQSQLDEWNFDVFEVARLTKGRPLFYMCMTLFRKFNFIQKFNLDRDKLCNYLNTIETGYHSDKPYHNSTHAADVTRTVNFFLARGGLKNYCTDLEMMAAIVASAVHDFDHPGVGNNFLVRLRDEKAILYNDKSVLENHHVATAFKQMLKPENNFLSNLTTKQFDELRKIMIEMVLATDLSHHFEFVGHFKAAMSKIDTTTDQSRLMILKMSLKCADVGHAAKAVSLHVKWTQRVIEEFYRQGDEERKANIPISPFMDRRKANVPKAQVGFIDFLVYPMYDSFSTFLNLPPTVIPCLAELQNNREYWKKLST